MKALTGISGLYWIAAVLIGIGSLYMHVTSTPQPQPKLTHRVSEVCYEAHGQLVSPEFQADTAIIKVTWVTGPIDYNGEKVVGLTLYTEPDPDTNTTICKLWIPMPTHVLGDDKMDTMGHELLHCLVGGFHD
jgi:hypothetical protein